MSDRGAYDAVSDYAAKRGAIVSCDCYWVVTVTEKDGTAHRASAEGIRDAYEKVAEELRLRSPA